MPEKWVSIWNIKSNLLKKNLFDDIEDVLLRDFILEFVYARRWPILKAK